MSTPPFWIIDRIRWRLGIQDPLPHPKAAPTPIPKPAPAAGMKVKAPGTESPIKTFGTGQESVDIYGALPFTKEWVQQVAQEGRNEAMEHEKQISAPILSYQGRGSEFSSQGGGLGLTDPSIVRGVQRWEAERRALLANTDRSIDEILPLARGQPLPRIKVGNAL